MQKSGPLSCKVNFWDHVVLNHTIHVCHIQVSVQLAKLYLAPSATHRPPRCHNRLINTHICPGGVIPASTLVTREVQWTP